MPIEIFVSVSQISMIVAVMTAEFFAKNDNRLGKRYVVRDLPEAEMSHHLGYKKSERSVYTAQDEPTAARIRDEVELKWSKKYPQAMKSWRMNWDAIVPIFKFSPTLRTIVYTTNAIESLNATYRQLNRQRTCYKKVDYATIEA